jgi:hypothetical protein
MSTTPVTQIDPPQPAGLGEYPLNALVPSTIKSFSTQAAYTAATGLPAPAWQPGLPQKFWIDTAASKAGFAMLAYNSAVINPAGIAVVATVSVPNYLAGTINMPPDFGTFAQGTAGVLATPIRALLPNEIILSAEGGEINVYNTSIYDPRTPNAPSTPAPGTSGGGFTSADQSELDAIAAAVGVKL